MYRRLALLGLVACGAPGPRDWTDAERSALARLRLDPTVPTDPTNRWFDDASARALGSILFFDPGYSGNGTVSCATCHRPEKHFADGQPFATGLGRTARHTPTVVGSQWGPWFFWDGRADSLWAQALGPMEADVEMGGDRMSIARYVTETHREWWEPAYGPAPDWSDRSRFPERARPGDGWMGGAWTAMSEADRAVVDDVFAKIGKAVAAYERTLVPKDSPVDHYVDAVLAGDPTGGGHLDEAEVRGLRTFVGRGLCMNCHDGPLLSDRAFHNTGVPGTLDRGRALGAADVLASPFSCRGPHSDTTSCDELTYLDPMFPDFEAAFKTPTLRYVAETAPYFHDGSAETLADVVAFYSTLPGRPPAGHRELTLVPVYLDEGQQADLVAFLEALSGPTVTP
jgi:cytochrome c peroxidase